MNKKIYFLTSLLSLVLITWLHSYIPSPNCGLGPFCGNELSILLSILSSSGVVISLLYLGYQKEIKRTWIRGLLILNGIVSGLILVDLLVLPIESALPSALNLPLMLIFLLWMLSFPILGPILFVSSFLQKKK